MRRRFVVLLVAVAILSGCSGGGSDDPVADEGAGAKFDPVPGMVVREGLVPISNADEALILKAEWRLANDCMAEQGFPPTTGPERFVTPEPPEYLSPTELRRGGYQFDFAAEAEGAQAIADGGSDPTVGMTPEERERFSLALGGDPDGPTAKIATPSGSRDVAATGCLADARKALFGTLENYMRYDQALEGSGPSALRKELARDDSYPDAVASWQSCMTDAGAGFPTAFEAGVDYGVSALRSEQSTRRDREAAPLSADEITQTATADADCQESSGLFELREKLLPDAREAVLAEFGLESSEMVALQRAVLEKAKGVR